MKKLVLLLLLSICIKGYSQSVKIADLPTLTTDATSTYVPVTKTGTTYKAEISNDTAASTNESSTIITKDAARKLARSSSLNTAANQTITAPLWDFKNNVAIGTDERAGLWMNSQMMLLGDAGNGNNTSIYINDNDWSKSVEVWADGGFHIWRPNGYNEGEDDPIEVTVFRNDGSIWAANGFFQLDDIGNTTAKSFVTELSNMNADGSGHFADNRIIFNTNGSVSFDDKSIYSDGNGQLNANIFKVDNPEANWGGGEYTTISSSNIDYYGNNENGLPIEFHYGIGGGSSSLYDEVGDYLSWNSSLILTKGILNQPDGYYSNYLICSDGAHGEDNTGDGNNTWEISHDGIHLTNRGTTIFNVSSNGGISSTTTSGIDIFSVSDSGGLQAKRLTTDVDWLFTNNGGSWQLGNIPDGFNWSDYGIDTQFDTGILIAISGSQYIIPAMSYAN